MTVAYIIVLTSAEPLGGAELFRQTVKNHQDTVRELAKLGWKPKDLQLTKAGSPYQELTRECEDAKEAKEQESVADKIVSEHQPQKSES